MIVRAFEISPVLADRGKKFASGRHKSGRRIEISLLETIL